MSPLKRFHPFDLILFAVALTLVAYLLVTVPNYRWSEAAVTSVAHGGPVSFLRTAEVTLTLETALPYHARIAKRLGVGPFEVATGSESRRAVIRSITDLPDGSVRLIVRLPVDIDGGGRLYWSGQALRRGELLVLGGRDDVLHTGVVAIDRDDGAAE